MSYEKFPALFNKVDYMDVVFRLELSREERRKKLPYLDMFREEFRGEDEIIFKKLTDKIIDEKAALMEITQLMKQYYGIKEHEIDF